MPTTLPPFVHAHATHPDWRTALSLSLAQISQQIVAHGSALNAAESAAGQASQAFTLGWCYLTDHFAGAAPEVLAALHERLPGVHWVGAVAVGVAACGVEYIDEPAMVLMLAALPTASFQVFSGRHPLPPAGTGGFTAHTALVHADGRTPDLAELLQEFSQRVATGYLFGGLASGRQRSLHIADDVFEGGLSGVAFAPEVQILSRVTQGCQPIGPTRRITEASGNLVMSLDGEPALHCLLHDLGADPKVPLQTIALQLRYTLAGLSDVGEDTLARPGQFGTDVRVRHLVGVEPARGYLSVAEQVQPGMLMAFCTRNPQAARRDLTRIATEIREELEGDPDGNRPRRQPAGALYVSCAGRGGPHFGEPHAELQLVRRALGDVPLVGFFAGGEIARNHLYGYTGVLTVFAQPAA